MDITSRNADRKSGFCVRHSGSHGTLGQSFGALAQRVQSLVLTGLWNPSCSRRVVSRIASAASCDPKDQVCKPSHHANR